MERNDREYFRRVVTRGNASRQYDEPLYEDVPIGELLSRLAADTSLLLRQEMSLARAEVKESGDRLQAMGKKLALAAALGLPGAMAVTAFLVIALGNAINSYVTSALIVGVVLLVVAWLVARQGIARVANGGVGLRRTARSLAEDARWGKEEARAFKREITA
jgi:Flp pilus assembly protein TadB